MKDTLGDRMKEYENISRIYLPKKTYLVCRIDGKSFHTYCKKLIKPFDDGFIDDMDETAAYLCKNIMGAKFAYVQSDEISILITDIGDNVNAEPWFLNNIQKMCSVGASMATSKFNQLRVLRQFNNLETLCNTNDVLTILENKVAEFDARIFQLPTVDEVINYFVFRQQDATRNSISSVAQSMYSPKELHGVKTDEMQEMIFQKGTNWNDFSPRKKRGGFVTKMLMVNGKPKQENQEIYIEDVVRNKWIGIDCPVFTQDRDFLRSRIPVMGV